MQVFGYYKSGAESEASVRFNREAYARFRLLPRVLVDVSKLDTSTTLLGEACLATALGAESRLHIAYAAMLTMAGVANSVQEKSCRFRCLLRPWQCSGWPMTTES